MSFDIRDNLKTLIKEQLASNNLEAIFKISKLLGTYVPDDKENIEAVNLCISYTCIDLYDEFRWTDWEFVDFANGKICQIRKDLFDRWKQEGRVIAPNIKY